MLILVVSACYEGVVSASNRRQFSWLQLCINYINHFIIPNNTHNVKNVELLKHIKIMEAAPTCFGLQRNHHDGATAST
jgi:hypothetical protein